MDRKGAGASPYVPLAANGVEAHVKEHGSIDQSVDIPLHIQLLKRIGVEVPQALWEDSGFWKLTGQMSHIALFHGKALAVSGFGQTSDAAHAHDRWIARGLKLQHALTVADRACEFPARKRERELELEMIAMEDNRPRARKEPLPVKDNTSVAEVETPRAKDQALRAKQMALLSQYDTSAKAGIEMQWTNYKAPRLREDALLIRVKFPATKPEDLRASETGWATEQEGAQAKAEASAPKQESAESKETDSASTPARTKSEETPPKTEMARLHVRSYTA